MQEEYVKDKPQNEQDMEALFNIEQFTELTS